MRSAALRVLLAVLPAIVLAILAGCSGKAAPEPISIGHLAPRTGPRAAVGKHAEQGIVLAVEEVNREENRIAGRPVTVRHVDTGDDPKTATQEAVRLITVNRVAAVLGNLEATPAESLGLEVQTYRVPVIVSAGLAFQPTSKYLFPIGPAPGLRGQALAQVAGQQQRQFAVAVLVPDRGPVPEALAEAFASQLGRDRVKKWSYPAGPSQEAESTEHKAEPDLEELARKVKAQMPGGVLVVGSAGPCLRMRAALRKAGIDEKVPFFFGGDEEALTALLEAGSQAEGIHATTAFCLDTDTPKGQEVSKRLSRAQAFATAYQGRFSEAADANAALAYDSARLLFEAMRRASTTDGDKVQEQLTGLLADFDSLTGPLPHRHVFVVQIRGGRLSLVDIYTSP
jgi:branched-chain amino acid transport system substrate-binding protein